MSFHHCDSARDGSDQLRTNHTLHCCSKIGHLDDGAALVSVRGQAFLRNRLRSSEDTYADMSCVEVLFHRQTLAVFRSRVDDAGELLEIGRLTLKLGWNIGFFCVQSKIQALYARTEK